MTLLRTLVAFSLLALTSACGGSGDSAAVPQAQPAEATSADIGDYVVHFSAQTTDQLPQEVAPSCLSVSCGPVTRISYVQ